MTDHYCTDPAGVARRVLSGGGVQGGVEGAAMTDNDLNRLVAAARTAVEAGRAYDRALSAVGSQIDAGEAPAFVDSDQLDTLYLAWLDAIDALARLVEVSND